MFSRILLTTCFVLSLSAVAPAQVDEICKEFGLMATLAAPRLTAQFVYGRVSFTNLDPKARFPKISVTYSGRAQSPARVSVGKTGNFCFRSVGGGGLLSLEIDGIEISRREIFEFGPAQRREDFDVSIPQASLIISKFSYPPNEKTTGHYKKGQTFEKEKNFKGAISEIEKIVEIDPKDFIAWAYLGNLQFEMNDLQAADASYRKALGLREDYTPAWVNVGKLRVAQKQLEAAIEIFKHAAALDPEDAKVFRLLGETYLQAKQGTLGAQALNHAIRLDPVGQAECHLQLAHLFQLAGAKDRAAAEYKKFLAKVPDHADKAKFEKYIKENQ